MKKLLLITLLVFYFSFFTESQIINTYAGNHSIGCLYIGDSGPATAAGMCGPSEIVTDSAGNLYIAELLNSVIRKVNTSGIISTFAGNGARGYSGDGGPSTAAELNEPPGVGIDKHGNLYIADQSNQVIRKIDTAGIISTVAGNYSLGEGYSGDGGPATQAQLYEPSGVAVDAIGNIYIADYINYLVRKVDTTNTISTFAGIRYQFNYSGDGGPATAAELNYPTDVMCDGYSNVYIADWGHNAIREVNTSGIINTIAGNGNGGFSGDGGPATAADLNLPCSVAIDALGNLYISDENNYVVRQVNTSGIISTFAGNHLFGGGYSGDGGPATLSEINTPSGVTLDALGNVYISDPNNYVIRKVSSITTGLNETRAKTEELSIYPDPSTGKFTINMIETPCMASLLTVYNIMEEKIFVETLSLTAKGSLNTIDLSSQASGVYLYRVADDNGKLIGQGKLVIQR